MKEKPPFRPESWARPCPNTLWKPESLGAGGGGGAGGGDSPSDKWAMGWGGGLKGLVLGWGRSWTQGQGQASVWLGEGRPVLGVIPEPASLCLSCQGSHAAPFLRSLTPKHVRAPEAGGGVSVRAP